MDVGVSHESAEKAETNAETDILKASINAKIASSEKYD